MKGYTIEHMESCDIEKPNIIEQCNYNGLKRISFYGWVKYDIDSEPTYYTVAIFKIKYKCDKST